MASDTNLVTVQNAATLTCTLLGGRDYITFQLTEQ